MSTTFSNGATVYDRYGRSGRYVAPVAAGHVVEQLYRHDEDDDSEPYAGPVQTWPEVFAKPPTEEVHAEVRELEQRATALRDQLDALREERRTLDAEHKARAERIKRHAQLAQLDDFIAGRITHLVICGSGVRVEEASKALETTDGERWCTHKKLRLLTLYGATQGNLTWGLSKYTDGSDHNTQDEVIPCLSFDAAMTAARERVASNIEALRTTAADRPWQLTSTLKNAAELGLDVPEDLAGMLAAYQLKTAREQLEKARTALADAQARVADLEGAHAIVGDSAQEA